MIKARPLGLGHLGAHREIGLWASLTAPPSRRDRKADLQRHLIVLDLALVDMPRVSTTSTSANWQGLGRTGDRALMRHRRSSSDEPRSE